MPITSQSLLCRLRSRADPAAWTRFVELYTPLLVHWAKRFGLQDHDVADLTQDVFSLLLDKLPLFQYDPNKRFRSWLRVVAHRRWFETYRRRVPMPIGAGDEATPLRELLSRDEPFWEHEYRQLVAIRALSLIKTSFQEKTWLACWKVVVLGEPAHQVAADLGLTVGAVYTAKCRVLKLLRQEFGDLLD